MPSCNAHFEKLLLEKRDKEIIDFRLDLLYPRWCTYGFEFPFKIMNTLSVLILAGIKFGGFGGCW